MRSRRLASPQRPLPPSSSATPTPPPPGGAGVAEAGGLWARRAASSRMRCAGERVRLIGISRHRSPDSRSQTGHGLETLCREQRAKWARRASPGARLAVVPEPPPPTAGGIGHGVRPPSGSAASLGALRPPAGRGGGSTTLGPGAGATSSGWAPPEPWFESPPLARSPWSLMASAAPPAQSSPVIPTWHRISRNSPRLQPPGGEASPPSHAEHPLAQAPSVRAWVRPRPRRIHLQPQACWAQQAPPRPPDRPAGGSLHPGPAQVPDCCLGRRSPQPAFCRPQGSAHDPGPVRPEGGRPSATPGPPSGAVRPRPGYPFPP